MDKHKVECMSYNKQLTDIHTYGTNDRVIAFGKLKSIGWEFFLPLECEEISDILCYNAGIVQL
jgi:hypothetical protein